MKRRTILKSGAGATVASGTGIGWFLLETDRAAASASMQQGITASDVSVSSNDGELDTLTLDPSLTVEWSNFPRPVGHLAYHVRVRAGQIRPQFVVTDVFRDFTASIDGSESLEIGVVNTLRKNRSDSVGLHASIFTDSTEGDGPEETDVTVVVAVYFADEDGFNIAPPGSGDGIEDDHLEEDVTFTVSVTNEEASGTATVSGALNTAGT